MSKLRWYNISLYKRNRLCLIQRDHSTSDSDVSNSSILESLLRFCWEPSRPLIFFRASSENTLDLLNKFPNSLTSHEIISCLDIALQLYFSLNLAITSCFTPIVFFVCLFVCFTWTLLLLPLIMNKDAIMVIEGYYLYLREGIHAALHREGNSPKETSWCQKLGHSLTDSYCYLILVFQTSPKKRKRKQTNKPKKQDKWKTTISLSWDYLLLSGTKVMPYIHLRETRISECT